MSVRPMFTRPPRTDELRDRVMYFDSICWNNAVMLAVRVARSNGFTVQHRPRYYTTGFTHIICPLDVQPLSARARVILDTALAGRRLWLEGRAR